MGQLINRISRYIKSEIDDKNNSSQNLIDKSDEELKRIIDELNREKTKGKKFSSKRGDNKDDYKSNHNKVFNIDDAFSVLDLKKDDDVEIIKAKYKQKIKEYHPDRVANLGIELKQLAEQKTQEINMAYDMIKKFRGFN